MKIGEAAREAWRGLSQHRLRAALSATGIVFGVAAVVAALAIAEGARRQAFAEVGALGLENVFVRSRPPAAGYDPEPRFTPADLTRAASDAGLGTVAAGVRRARGVLQHGSAIVRVHVAGVTASWAELSDVEIAVGRWLSDADTAERRRVIVLGPVVARRLLGPSAGIGARVRWRDEWFTVIGRMRTARRVEGQADAYIPVTAADVRLGPHDRAHEMQEIAFRVAAASDIDLAARDVARALERRGHPADSFEVVIPRALLRARLRSQRTFDWVLFGIGGLALAISGIGIMNIMLASVAERTAEIGVRRAAGARRRDVLVQFAGEAGMLCLSGGVAGVPLGVACAGLIAAGAGWPVAVSIESILLAVALAVAVGLLSGILPARRAAAINPIDALRV